MEGRAGVEQWREGLLKEGGEGGQAADANSSRQMTAPARTAPSALPFCRWCTMAPAAQSKVPVAAGCKRVRQRATNG